MDSFVLVAHANLAALRTLLEQLLACLNFIYFRFRRSTLFAQLKKMISIWAMAAAQTTENHGDERGFSWYLWWGKYIKYIDPNLNPLTKFNSSSQNIVLLVYWKLNGNWDNNMIRISQWKESHCRTNTSIRRKK